MGLKKSKEEKKESRKNSILSIIVTILVVVLLFVFAWFTVVWSPPDPPVPQYGIEVNFGIDNAGSGQEQQETPVVEESESLDEPAPAPVEEATEEVVEEVVESVEEVVQEEIPEPTEAVAEEAASEPEAVTDAPVEESVQTAPEPKVETKKEEPEVIKPEVKPQEPAATMGPPKSSGASSDAKTSNNGNVDGAVGDQGDRQGTINSNTLMHSAGGSGGSSLNMPGWNWVDPPIVDDKSTATGIIKFEIQVDDFGEVIALRTIYRSVPREVVMKYEAAVKNLSFSPTRVDSEVASITTGQITFVLKRR
ncbi:hypothetical protein [Flammeovirga sp. SubArs3]|uniref:hypothetical protein n=1 Tax=Flammeovirga sp. SubArs3 TaxID=2995316 RepID=UPI00248B2D04|nr:hypothetical protein [Flammeovirga sp. SubArs3]